MRLCGKGGGIGHSSTLPNRGSREDSLLETGGNPLNLEGEDSGLTLADDKSEDCGLGLSGRLLVGRAMDPDRPREDLIEGDVESGIGGRGTDGAGFGEVPKSRLSRVHSRGSKELSWLPIRSIMTIAWSSEWVRRLGL